MERFVFWYSKLRQKYEELDAMIENINQHDILFENELKRVNFRCLEKLSRSLRSTPKNALSLMIDSKFLSATTALIQLTAQDAEVTSLINSRLRNLPVVRWLARDFRLITFNQDNAPTFSSLDVRTAFIRSLKAVRAWLHMLLVIFDSISISDDKQLIRQAGAIFDVAALDANLEVDILNWMKFISKENSYDNHQ